MKTVCKNSGIVVLALFLCSAATNCSKDQPCPVYEDQHYHISEEEMALVPYHGYDTLTFLRFQGNHVDTITFAGQGIQDYIEYDSYGYGEHHCDGRLLKHSVYTDYVSNDSLGEYRYKFKSIPEGQFSSYLIEIENYSLRGKFARLAATSGPFYFEEFIVDSLTFKNVTLSSVKPHIHIHNLYFNLEYGVIRIELRDSTIIYQLIP